MKPTTVAERMLEISSITMSLDWMLTRDNSRRRAQRPAFDAACPSLADAAACWAESGGASVDEVIARPLQPPETIEAYVPFQLVATQKRRTCSRLARRAGKQKLTKRPAAFGGRCGRAMLGT